MKKKELILFLLLLFSKLLIFSQYSNKKYISIEFKNLNIKSALKFIEQKTSYHFFYKEEWMKVDKIISKKFTNSSIDVILDYIFYNTDINYFIFEETNVILTKNNSIYDSVYKNKGSSIDSKELTEPIILSSENKNTNKIKTVKIGRDSYKNRRNSFTLTGVVKNKTTQIPIANLVIIERNKNIYTTTDTNGRFSIKLPFGVNVLETILSGIKQSKTKFIIYGNGTYNFNLENDIELLEEVVIKTNTINNIKNVVTGVSQIKAEGIKTIPQVLGERDILKVATTLPGIKNTGEGSEGINVRGGKSDQNLFLLDKSVIYNPNHFLGLFSAINPFTTKDLKIYKGSVPAEFGGRISSVFDIVSKNSNTKKLKGEASVGPVSSNVSLDIPIIKEKSGLILGARSTYSDWILKAIDNKELNNSDVSFYDIIAKYTHRINDKNSVDASFYVSKDKFSIASDTTNSYGNRVMSFNWFHKFNDKNKSNLLISNSNYSFEIAYEANGNSNFNLKYNINEYNIKYLMTYLHSKKHKIKYGISSKLYNVNPGSITPKGKQSLITAYKVQQERALETSFFISDNYKINKKLNINLGARYNIFNALGASTKRTYATNSPKNDLTVTEVNTYKNNEIHKTHHGLSMRFSSIYAIDDDLSIKASLNNSYQFIHRLTNNTTATPTDTWRLSDQNIKPQEAIQVALGVYKNIFENTYELSLEGYYKKYKNILDFKVGASFLLNEFIETEILQGPGESYGIEFLLRKNKGNFNGWLSYTYSRSFLTLDSPFLEETINNGNPFPTNFDKPHDLNIIANYKLTKRFSLSTNITYQTGRPITYPTGKYVSQGNEFLIYSDRNKFRIPDYYRVDIGINIEGNHKLKKLAHSFWNFSVYNLFGRNNPYSIFFVTENGQVKAYQSSIFSRPIPTITYNIKF